MTAMVSARADQGRREAGAGRRRRRVLFLIDGLGRGGAEALLVPYARHLRDTGHDVRICATGVRDGNPVAAALRADGIPVDVVRVDKLRSLPQAVRLWRYLAGVDPDLVHCQLECANVLGTLGARLLGIPAVSTLHTVDARPPFGRALLRWLAERFVLSRLCDRIVCVSDAVRRHALANGWGSHDRTRTLINGIDLAPFTQTGADRAAVRGELGVPPAAAVMVTVAVLRRPKGIEHMLAALPAIAARIPEAHYLVVGDGDDRDRLVRCAADAGVAGRVTFAGFRGDVARLLPATDLFVLPTLDDALPTAIMEAMAAGLPVVASRVGGIPEMTIDGESALLVAPADPAALAGACSALLADPARARRMGQAGRRLAAERFDVDLQAERLARIYAEVIAHRKR
jgi:glycosyltransferase involved in cell wall biosynthesis